MSADGSATSPGATPGERRGHARRRQILDLAAQIAEDEGWDAVTTRRLAAGIDYSQPVIYQHFSGRGDVIRAVTLEGFVELGRLVRRRTSSGDGQAAPVAAACSAYLDFARNRPRLYAAMFSEPTSLVFADEETPTELREAFNALSEAINQQVPDRDPVPAAELLWACCHGLATLEASQRIPAEHLAGHLDRIVAMITRPV